jgi:hypothetical protein
MSPYWKVFRLFLPSPSRCVIPGTGISTLNVGKSDSRRGDETVSLSFLYGFDSSFYAPLIAFKSGFSKIGPP